MATEAIQIDALWSGLNDPLNGKSYSGAIVATFASGTSTPKAVWTDKEKTLPAAIGQSQFTLDSNGQAFVFGDGKYKINVYAPTDTGLTSPLMTIDGATYQLPSSGTGISLSSIYECDLASAIAGIGSTETTLIVDCDAIIASGTTVTIPSTLAIEVINGGSFDGVAGGGTETLNINGPFNAGVYQVFGSSLAVAGLSEAVPEWWGNNTTPGTTDFTDAMQAAIAAIGPNSLLTLSATTYLITDELLISENRVHISGAGIFATTVLFMPTTDATLFKFEIPGSTVTQGSLKNLRIWSDDSTYAKTAIDLYDSSGYSFDDIVIGGSIPVSGVGYWNGGTGSVGIRTHGRDSTSFDTLFIFADIPILVSPNPNGALEISMDHFNFNNCFFGANGNPIITIEPGCVLTQVSFTGYQAWIRGTGGIYWVDATTPGKSVGLRLENVRYENPTDDTKYFVNIDIASGIIGLDIVGGQAGGLNGFYLRGVQTGRFSSFAFTLAGYEAMNVDNTVSELNFDGCFWQGGSTSVFTDVSVVNKNATVQGNAGGVPTTGYIIKDAGSGGYEEYYKTTLTDNSVQMQQNDTLILGDVSQTGFIMITVQQDNSSAFFSVNGALQSTTELFDTRNFYSVTKDTADQFNIYFDAGSGNYLLQNGWAVLKTVRVLRFGRAQ